MEFDHFNWSEERLTDRSLELEALSHIPHGEARRAEIQHELDCVAFEVGRRIIEKYEKEQANAITPPAA